MPDQVPGGVYDIYRLRVINAPATYTGPNTEDFDENAVHPQAPTQPSRTRAAAYGAQQTVDSWNTQLRQLHKQV